MNETKLDRKMCLGMLNGCCCVYVFIHLRSHLTHDGRGELQNEKENENGSRNVA